MRSVFYFYNMHGFIKNVLKDIIKKKISLTENIFILPNKRSGLFLKREISKISNKTFFSPVIYDIDEFMSIISEINKISDTELLFDLYEVYLKNEKPNNHQSFDEFIRWGKTLINDFNEIDREICNTESLFNYLEAIKELNHWSNYESETEIIKNYKTFWKNIKILYKDLQEVLFNKRKGYQGLIYREATERIQNYVENQKGSKHIFIGFNALSKSESEIIQEIIQNQLGEIYWDIDERHLKSGYNNASYFIDSYFKNWTYFKNNKPNIISEMYSEKKNISTIGTPKNIGQVKYVGEILSKMNTNDLNDTAIILSDEKLLIPMINSIPKEIKNLNITMGYPFKYSSVFSLFNVVLKIHSKKQKNYYYKNIFSILSHELIKPILNKDKDICLIIKKNNLIYISKNELIELDKKNSEIYELLFSKWADLTIGIKSCIQLIDLLKKHYNKKKIKDNINLEFLYNAYKIFNQIMVFVENYKSIKNINSLRTMYKEIGEMNTIPFSGNPDSGLQIMGMLESRLLNYKNIIIMSLNEGILPKGNSTNSFIPYEIKKKNGLQTFSEKDAVFAYHFYRIIKRAKNIWLTYNTEPDGLNNGEVSRFIKQIEIEKIHTINNQILVTNIPKINKHKIIYRKTKSVKDKLGKIFKERITVSMLCSYVLNKEKFFEDYIIQLKEDKIEETIAANTLGNVIHDTLEEMYKSLIGEGVKIKHLNKIKENLEKIIVKNFKKYVNEKNIKKGKNIIIVETAKKYVESVIKLDMLEIKRGNKLKIISLEKEFEKEILIGKGKYKIKGKIDRIDQINKTIRVIDYKTGKKLYARNLNIKELNKIRTKEGIYNLQLLFYLIGVYEKYNIENMEVGIISIKNMSEGILTAKINNSSTFNKNKIIKIKEEIKIIIKEILYSDIDFKND